MYIQHQEVTGTTFRHLFHFYRMSQKKVPWPTDYFGQLAKKLQEIVWRYLGDISWVIFGWNQPLIWQSILWNASLVQILTSNFEQKTWKRVNFFMGHPVWQEILYFPLNSLPDWAGKLKHIRYGNSWLKFLWTRIIMLYFRYQNVTMTMWRTAI